MSPSTPRPLFAVTSSRDPGVPAGGRPRGIIDARGDAAGRMASLAGGAPRGRPLLVHGHGERGRRERGRGGVAGHKSWLHLHVLAMQCVHTCRIPAAVVQNKLCFRIPAGPNLSNFSRR